MQDLTALTRTYPNVDPKALARASQQARDFESVFIHTMLETMTTGLDQSSGFGGGAGSDQWRSILNEEMAKGIAAQGGFGLSTAILRDLIGLQEKAGGAATS
jgi:Rod binding domain-containing protein